MELDRQIHHFDEFQANAMSGSFLMPNRPSVLSFPSMAQRLIVGRRRHNSFLIYPMREKMMVKQHGMTTGATRAEGRVDLENR